MVNSFFVGYNGINKNRKGIKIMTYRFDIRHLPAEQQAVINAKDREEKLRKESTKKNITEVPKETLKKECPYCNSNNIESVGMGHSVNGQPLKKQYICKECKRIFYIIDES